MRDSLEAKMWGEVWERDFEAVPDYWQGSKIKSFIFPFLQSSLHLCSLRHFLHSTIPFHNKPSLPNDENSEEIRQRSSRGFPKPYRLCRCGCQCCRSFGKQQFQSTQCRTCFQRNEKRNRTCKYTWLQEDLEAEQVQLASQLGTSSSTTSVGSVRSPGSRLAAPLGQQANLGIKFCKISFKVC